jgi:hypothetical protein
MKLQRWALFRGSLEPATNGPWVQAYDAEALEKRVQELEGLESEKQKLINVFKSCRDATGYSETYFRGMYNGIEWARSCLENNEPEYKDSVEKSEQIYELTCAEAMGGVE